MRGYFLLLISLLSTKMAFGQRVDGSLQPIVLEERFVFEEYISSPELTTPTGIAVTPELADVIVFLSTLKSTD